MARTLFAAPFVGYTPAMSLPLHVITAEALALDAADRLRLATDLIDSVEGPTDPQWTAAWRAELRARSAAADAREVRGEDWAAVRSDLLRELATE